MSSSLASQVASQLRTTKSIVPSQAWLNSFISSQRPTTPVPALAQTALFRILASDITTSLDSSPSLCFPQEIQNPRVEERPLSGSIVVQILDIEDMGKSRWEQIEAIESLERGEGTKGREIIRVVSTESGEDPGETPNSGGGPHKLLLQDTKGLLVYAIELRGVHGIGLGMSIGSKLTLKNALIARGVVLLEPATTTLLGGKIESLHKTWKEERKARLKAALEANREANTGS
ncbi:hypothetical protein MMC20_007065 [Loxospora ochrophaea]|nr:hypothetical protein [Loxospora ochrophaea]